MRFSPVMRFAAASRTLAVLVPLAVALALPPATAAAGVRSQENPGTGLAEGFRLPSELVEPSPWVPLVTQDPVPAAAALLPATVAHGRWNRETGRGFVLLSADGRQYRRLPYRESDTELVGALSPDGRWVAQVNRASNPLRLTGLVVTLLRLGEPNTRDVVLPEAEGLVRYLLFDQDGSRLYLVTGSTGRSWLWAVDTAAGKAELVCSCPARLGVDPDGAVHLHRGTPQAERLGLPLYGAAGEPAQGWLGRYPDALAEDGSWAELHEYDQVRVVGGGQDVPRVLQPDEGAHAVPLWLGNGRLIVAVGGDDVPRRVDGFRLLSVDLATKEPVTALTAPPARGGAGPALALGAVLAPGRRPTAATGVPWWSGDRRAYHLGAVPEELAAHPVRDGAAAVAVLAAAGLLVVRRRRRRALR